MPKKIAIIGAGPGGLSAAMLLGHAGHRVTVFEVKDHPGGRNSRFRLGGYTFDVGPTFLLMRYILDELFRQTGRRIEDYVELRDLAPMYRLFFADKTLDMYQDHAKTRAEIARAFPGQEAGFDRFLQRESERFERIQGILARDNCRPGEILTWTFLKSTPWFALGRSIIGVLGDYFTDLQTKLSFTFQSKYLGMSPWECPGAFSIIPYVEHAFGIQHVQGGLAVLAETMAKVAAEDGVTFRYSTRVKRLTLDGRRVTGIELEDGEKFEADEVVINADFAYAMNELVPPGVLRKWSPEKLAKKRYSCSVFMLYLGVDGEFPDLKFHNIVFAKDYVQNVKDIWSGNLSGPDLSYYVRNASLVDKTLAPPGKSNVYVLVPVPNKQIGRIDWKQAAPQLREYALDSMERCLGMKDIRRRIEVEKILTPDDFEGDFMVYRGATFNLAHSLRQMLWFRPRNKFEELDNCYIVGGGTHPGSGLPTIYQSGRIAAELIGRD